MHKTEKIPLATIPRLSIYYRALLERSNSNLTSSDELAGATGFTAAQVRKDLAYFGQFGARGKGYEIDVLKDSIIKILGTNREWSVALVGVGNLGSALLSYRGFQRQGFKIVSVFDSDLRKIGKTLEGVTVKDVSELESDLEAKKVDLAIVAVPQDVAQDVVNKLVGSGIKAVLNFAPIRPRVPDDVRILNIDLSIELERLAYFLTRAKKE